MICDAFHRLLSGRFPEAHLLSHDLIEGIHVRVALATDIDLLDVFPSSYIAWWNRQHRWIRGDWQIIDWLKTRVPAGGGGEIPNPIPAFGRWKIFDNLRRSVVPVAAVALLLLGWLFTPTPALWSLAVAGLLLWPVLNSLLALLLHPPPLGTKYWRDSPGRPRALAAHGGLPCRFRRNGRRSHRPCSLPPVDIAPVAPRGKPRRMPAAAQGTVKSNSSSRGSGSRPPRRFCLRAPCSPDRWPLRGRSFSCGLFFRRRLCCSIVRRSASGQDSERRRLPHASRHGAADLAILR